MTVQVVDIQRLEGWPLTLDMIKQHLRIDHDDEDDLLLFYQQSAIDYARTHRNGPLYLTKYRYWLDDWFCDQIRLPQPPFRAITGVFYYDAEGVLQALPMEQVQTNPHGLDCMVQLIGALPAVASGLSKVFVEYISGYGRYVAATQVGFPYTLPIIFGIEWNQSDTPAGLTPTLFDEEGTTGSNMDIPQDLRNALLMHINVLYEGRESEHEDYMHAIRNIYNMHRARMGV